LQQVEKTTLVCMGGCNGLEGRINGGELYLSLLLYSSCCAQGKEEDRKWRSLSDGIGGSKDSPWNPYVSTAERNQVLFQSRSAQAGSNQQHDTCLTKCRLQ
jgi:hypothetical protein